MAHILIVFPSAGIAATQEEKLPVGTMTARERVRAALSHRQPDRVPMDLGGMNSSSMVVEGYERLKRHFGVEVEVRLADRMQRIVEIDEPILRALGIDTRRVSLGVADTGLAADLGPRLYRDMWGVVRENPEGSYYFDLKTIPLAGEITASDILRYPWPNPDDPGFVRGLKERVRWIREHTDAAVVLALPAPFVHISQYLRGFEDWFCDCAADLERLGVLFDAVMDVTL
jgi:uroporphyrinogen decarboxylase